MNTPAVALFDLPAMTVRYRFVSVSQIVGLSNLPQNRDETLPLGTKHARAFLTVDPNATLAAVDRGVALLRLMLAGFEGKTEGAEILRAVEDVREQRAKERPHAVYLVVEAEGEVTSSPTKARDLGDAVLAPHAVDKETITATHQALVDAAVAALIVPLDTSPNVVHILDGVELTLPDGRQLFSFSARPGAPRLSLGRPATTSDVRNFEKALRVLLAGNDLATPSRLLVDALLSRNDHLEAFILAWDALEMVIRKQTVNCESGEWVHSVPEKLRALAVALHGIPRTSGPPRYSLADRSRAFALLHGSTDGDTIAAQVTRLRRTYREPLYHEGRFEESSLPVDAVLVMRSTVDSASRGN